MAHQIEKDDSMFSVAEVPWHGLGKVIDGFPETAEQAMEIAGLSWKVDVQELWTQRNDADGSIHRNLVEGFFGVVRQDTLRTLGIVKSRYVPIQNSEAFGFFDKISGDEFVQFHTAGSLKNGALVWVLAKLPEDIIIRKKGNGVKDDKVEEYCLLVNSHDGSQTLKALMTPVRVVCHNTLSMALKGAERTIDILHGHNAVDKLTEATESIGILRNRYKLLHPIYQRMADTPMLDAQVHRYVDLVLAPTQVSEGRYCEITTDLQNARDRMLKIYQSHDTVADWRGSVWGVYNAATAWADHERKFKNDDTKMNSLWFGDSAVKKTEALAAAVSFCDCPDLIPLVGQGSDPIERNNFVANGMALLPL